ncbi:SNF2 family N-terminal domain-containing protein [Chaetomium strumarium]|uniref:SNF2 family N-terminal domain-containing protein n=1 Tax=Chaetomium strumarium TaxID=1170767 RepID=A0AAJ0M3X1_9PEZI|nr:SNF2 family N-terminal domain-containing protein [Chaetomium strumarium]
MAVRHQSALLELELQIEVEWNERTTIWGSERSNSQSQQALREEVLKTCERPSWSPQDFYEAACVPDKASLDAAVSSMEIPKLEATLYPFQRRAVQWLLRREGAEWSPGSHARAPGVRPYVMSASSELPISFTSAKDADGSTIYLSPLLGVATRDTALFRSVQDLRGGILAEEMGLGKTLEMIALILLHRRLESPVMVFDPFLGRDLLTASATLIIAPSTLLDQWLSELSLHAPSLKVMFYPGVKKIAKLKPGSHEISAEQLAQQDVVITTYEVLRSEIWAASDEPGRTLRNEQQYERLKSPLVQLSWWRVCIDEAQMVENWTNNSAKLARKIPRVNAWGVTGTPVKDDIRKDLRGLLLFLRYEPYASDAKTWKLLTTFDKGSFRKLFRLISMRHSKSLVRDEISIPPQKRYVITTPFTAVEQEYYQSLFEELAATCGLDAQGNPLQAGWDPEEPSVQSAMRVALDRLRQTVLHPEVGNRVRRAFGQKVAPIRTVAEVLDAMMEQSDSAIRAYQRSLLLERLYRGQMLASKATETVTECRVKLDKEVEEARKGSTREPQLSPDDGGEEDRDEVVAPRVGEARRRLRSALEIQHAAVFFCANAYFSLKSNIEVTVPDSEEFKRLERLETEGYHRAREIRKEILHESHTKAKKLMGRLERMAERQAFGVIPGFKSVDKKGIESSRIAEALEDLSVALDEQAVQLDNWREHVLQLLLKPLVDEEVDETTGEEYGESAKLQDEILVYLQILRTALADRHEAITGQKNFLVEHEIEVAARMAGEGDGPAPKKLLGLLRVREIVKPRIAEGYVHTSMRGLVSELRGLSVQFRHDAASGSSRAAKELAIASDLLRSTLSRQAEQTKAITVLEKEIEKFMDTLNARIDYYRQLQEVSDMVADYADPTESDALNIALQAGQGREERLQAKLAAAESKYRYLVHLKEAESSSEEQRTCVICQSTFTIGALTVCGHQFCKECITLWLRAHRNCPVCKRHLHRTDLHDIALKPQELKVRSETHHRNNTEDPNGPQPSPTRRALTIYSEFNAEKLAEIKNMELDGPSFTTKVDTLTRHILWLREADPGSKSIVFSQYKEFLDVLAVAFQRYRIGFTSFDKAHGITSFKEDPATEVFLLHARAHASGLNLVNANHVFLCEPLLNTALELQAIARVDRIGQLHETTVWLYVVDGTVEESIYELSVRRRMEHMGRNAKGRGRGNGAGMDQKDKGTDEAEAYAPVSLDTNLDEANALEMQQAHLSKLMGRDGVAGEAVDGDDLWTCLFGHLQRKAGREDQNPVNESTRRFLAAEAAERRMGEGDMVAVGRGSIN